MKYRIGIIDDDETKITQLLTYIKLALNDEDGNLIKDKYKGIELEPFSIKLVNKVELMVNEICYSKPDALVVDFKLSSQQNISYTGIALAKAVDKKLRGFPLFMLTSYQDDLYTNECFDVYQVFDFDRYLEDENERLEINSKIIEQIKKYKRTIMSWRKEFEKLLPQAGKSSNIDERILELDGLIENSINGNSALSLKVKKDLGDTKRLKELIDKLDLLIQG